MIEQREHMIAHPSVFPSPATSAPIRLAGYQPQYFPRLHYYARILNADIYKISDNLQYVRRHAYPGPDGKTVNGPSYQAHTPIKSGSGTLLLDIPVRHGGNKSARTMDTAEIDYASDWPRRHLAAIEFSYRKAPSFPRLYPSLHELLRTPFPNLAACTVATTLWGLMVLFELPLVAAEVLTIAEIGEILPYGAFRLKRIVRMSESALKPADKSAGENVNDWIIEQCRSLGANEYYMGGTASSAYIDRDRIQAAGITLLEQDWYGSEYPQQFPRVGFLPNLSILDLLMNVSPGDARRILATPNQ